MGARSASKGCEEDILACAAGSDRLQLRLPIGLIFHAEFETVSRALDAEDRRAD